MEKIFWVSCPSCRADFYANYQELRHAAVSLFCPRCHHRFLPEEAAWLDDRAEQADAS
jgi:predicted Zn finger-like uncharacterized protein